MSISPIFLYIFLRLLSIFVLSFDLGKLQLACHYSIKFLIISYNNLDQEVFWIVTNLMYYARITRCY